jgi:hypothetical protein
MKLLHKYIAVALLLAFTGCTEKIDLDLDSIPPAIVIEGRISNGTVLNYVRISESSPYLSDADNQPVLGATITLTEDGYYYCPLLWAGKLNSVYTLTVNYSGETYVAFDTIRPVTALDSLGYDYEDKPGTDNDGYYVSLYAQEPAGFGNYYQWSYFSNGAEKAGLEWNASDEFVDGNYINFQFEFDDQQELGDTVAVEMSSISLQYFKFVNQLLNQESSGNLFDTPPANVLGNFTNGAFGYFHADGVAADTIILR